MKEFENYIGNWGTCNFDKDSIHIDDHEKLDNYPFKEQWHKCIGVDSNFLCVKFSCIQLKLKRSSFVEISPPDFMPFDKVKYISSKGKLEIGTITSYSSLRKPYLRKVYILNVNGKIKSTLYEKERLKLIKDTSDILKDRENLNRNIFHILLFEINHSDLEGWVKINELINLVKLKKSGWQSLQYYDILKMIDLSTKKYYELKTKRIGPEYKKNYEWYIRINPDSAQLGKDLIF